MSNIARLPREVRGGAEVLSDLAVESNREANEGKFNLDEIQMEEIKLEPESRLIFYTDSRSVAADKYRLLRMRLRELWTAGKLKTLLITSPLPEDGKSTTAINLASALSDHGRSKVLLIEADLYHSPLAETLGLSAGPGLAECIESGLEPKMAIRKLQPVNWFVLRAGQPQGNPTELLQTDAFARVMRQATASFDWVLIDSPPVIPLTDALLLRRYANGTLLIARAGRTPKHAIEKSLSLIGREHILGIVLNAAERINHLYSKYSSYYYPNSHK